MKSHKGVTFIELMVVIVIIGIMTGTTLVSVRGSQTGKELESAAREVAAAVREAQNYALTGKKLTSSCSYNFVYVNGTANYNIGGCISPAVNYILKNGVTFGSGGSFDYYAPHGNVSSSNKILLFKKSKYRTVCVNSSGAVEEKSGNAACP